MLMHPSQPQKHIALVVLIGLSLYILLPRLGGFQAALAILAQADGLLVGFSLLFITTTFFTAAYTYQVLAAKRLHYLRTVLVAVANMFTNRLLPAGTGSIATFYLYLRRQRLTYSQAASLIAVNNFAGTFGHLLLLAALFIFMPSTISRFDVPRVPISYLLAVLSLVIIFSTILASKRSWYQRFKSVFKRVASNIATYRTRPVRLGLALLSSIWLTVLNAAALWCCLLAVDITLGFAVALVVFSVGMLVGTATPTPGGLGGAEAGLLAGLVGYGIAADQALAAVLLYRLVSYWLPLLAGIASYTYISRRGYLFRPS